MAAEAKTKPVKAQAVWAIYPDSEMETRFYKAKSKYQNINPGPLSDREFHKIIMNEGLKKFVQ